jgi:hypothetical protein
MAMIAASFSRWIRSLVLTSATAHPAARNCFWPLKRRSVPLACGDEAVSEGRAQ